MATSFLGRLRPLLLLWLLSSSEILSVYASVPKAAQHTHNSQQQASGGGGLFKSWRRGSRNEEVKHMPGACLAQAGKVGSADVCTAAGKGGKALKVATLSRGGHGGHSHGGGGAGGEQGMPLNMVKLLLTACLTTLNVACWLLPLKMRRFTESKVGISMANAFSGGVFLSLAFGHMLPHAAHGFENSGLPESTPFYLTLTGYLLIFFVEKIAFDTHEMLHDAHDNGPHSPSTIKPIDSSNSAQVAASGRSATVLLLALSVHSLFETMALGLSTSRLNALLLAMSIGLHQPAESLALLVSFLKTGLPQGKIVKMLALFSCVGPLGVGLGVAAAQYAGDLVDAVLVSLAAGTFVYVGATEVVADEFETPHHKWKKFAALLGGVVLIAYITSWAELLEGRAT